MTEVVDRFAAEVEFGNGYEHLSENHKYVVARLASTNERIDVLDALWSWHSKSGTEKKLHREIFSGCRHYSVLDWLHIKTPDVSLWRGPKIWDAMYSGDGLFEWLCCKLGSKVLLQQLAVDNITYLGKRDADSFSENVMCLRNLGRSLWLDAKLFELAVSRGHASVASKIAAGNRGLISSVCLADQGKVLRAAKRRKIHRVLSRELSRSDYASVGLDWQLA